MEHETKNELIKNMFAHLQTQATIWQKVNK